MHCHKLNQLLDRRLLSKRSYHSEDSMFKIIFLKANWFIFAIIEVCRENPEMALNFRLLFHWDPWGVITRETSYGDYKGSFIHLSTVRFFQQLLAINS